MRKRVKLLIAAGVFAFILSCAATSIASPVLSQVTATTGVSVEVVMTILMGTISGVSSFWVAQINAEKGDRAIETKINETLRAQDTAISKAVQQGSERLDLVQANLYQGLRDMERGLSDRLAILDRNLALLSQESQRGDADHGTRLDRLSESLTIVKGHVNEIRMRILTLERDSQIRQGINSQTTGGL